MGGCLSNGKEVCPLAFLERYDMIYEKRRQSYGESEKGEGIICGAAFAGVAVTELNLPSTVKSIGSGGISSCPNLTSLVIPEGVEQIKQYTLGGCPSLTSLTIPESVTFIYENPIGENEALTIYGKAGSLAEKFATDYGFKFVAQ